MFYKTYTREVLIDTYKWDMLPKSVICPRCKKQGFLTLRWVRSSHYCKIKHPYLNSKYVKKEIINPIADEGKELTKLVDRWYVTYRPSVHPYIGHYDEEKYKKAMEKYKNGRLKSRPNGRRWCKVRFNRVKDQAQSDLEKLMSKYNFNLRDLRNEIKEKEEDHRIRNGIF
jgi:hypothetical protein